MIPTAATAAPASPASQSKLLRLAPAALALVVLAVCLGMTWQSWRSAQRDATLAWQSEFNFRARETVNALARRMSSYVLVLRGAQGLFASSTQVTRDEFSAFVQSQQLHLHVPGFFAIGFMEAVHPGQERVHVARMQAAGYPEYAIVGVPGVAGAVPLAEAALAAPVTMIEPFDWPNRRAFGADGYSEPVRRLVLEQARNSGQPAMSGKLMLLQDRAQRASAGFLIALPVYRNGMPTGSVGARRAAIAGWVFAPLRMADLIAGLQLEHGDELDLEIYDGLDVSAQSRWSAGGARAQPSAVLMRSRHQLGVAGRSWTLVIGARQQFADRLDSGKAQVIGASGLAASVILSLLIFMLARSNAVSATLLRKARLLTGELEGGQKRLLTLADSAQRAQAMLRSILDSTNDAILVDDGNGRVLLSNQRFRQLWSVPEQIDLHGDERELIAQLLGQLLHPAPFQHSRKLPFNEHGEQRSLLRLIDGRFVEQITRPIRLGAEFARLCLFRDVTERKQTEQRERSHRHVLELLARGAPLHGILDSVVLGVEATNPGLLASIMLLDASGHHLHDSAAPSLPDFFRQAIDGVALGAHAISCASTVTVGARVIVEDIASHPDWQAMGELTRRAQLGACWSQPVRGASGRLLGSFSIYQRAAAYPSPANVVLMEQAAQLTGIAVEQAQAGAALRAGEERFRSLYNHAPVALWEQDWSLVREACNMLLEQGVGELGAYLRARPDEALRLASLVRMLDLNAAALAHVGAVGKNLTALSLAQNFGALGEPGFIDALVALFDGALFFSCESSFLRLDGQRRHHQLTLLVMPGHAHKLDYLIVSTLDITERKRVDAELLMLATTDFLTGLSNRRAFMQRLDDELARLQRHVGECASVLMLDIDHFKNVNDEFGHAGGDAVLRHMTDLMRRGQRKIDTLGRVGGEEFAVLLPGANVEAAMAYAERLREDVAASILSFEGRQIGITVSIGIAGIYMGDASADAALNRADKALYLAKQAGRNQVCQAPAV
jgi:diguanylate cyclase (GGDEF)-like protein